MADDAKTVHTVTVTLETRDVLAARTLSRRAADWAQELSVAWEAAGVDWDVSTGRHVEGELAMPDSLIEEIVRRVRGELPAESGPAF